ncbi:pilus assembly protein [Streptomyces sp. A3M-1-3]|uniref:TadE/TadG family type IV pilus assembly protein n=1 Tax=Streptomyces sp. A3M-1-3 TaxID=2962044 RepID=UPI0020B87BC1|nr:TadE family protein [Streptomyces sp. A3M-1-3]MCP3819059.1 pilus assembly protein [Streptomyces sp. A3M-1-3]
MRDVRTDRRLRSDRGQTAIEFVGVTPLIIFMLVVLWQCALIGYTFSLAGNAADMGARAGAVGDDCGAAMAEDLPDAWDIEGGCEEAGGIVRARATLHVPVLVPGVLNFPMAVEGEAGAAKETP